MLFYPNEYKVYSPKVEPLLVKVTWFHRKKNQKNKRNQNVCQEELRGSVKKGRWDWGAFLLTVLLKCVSGSWGWIS